PSVLPRPCRHLPGRRSCAQEIGAGRARPRRSALDGGAGRDRRSLEPLAGCGRGPLLGLLPDASQDRGDPAAVTQPSLPRLEGPRLAPASGRPARSLVVFLHGFGADGNDLIDLGRHWAGLLPDTAFASPHAPE